MRKRDYILASIVLIFCSGVAAQATSVTLLNKPIFSLSGLDFNGTKVHVAEQSCSKEASLEGLASSADPHLRKMSEYYGVCKGFPGSRVMIFTDMPNSNDDAVAKADLIAGTLKEFEKYKIPPLVIIEPVTNWGFVDFKEFRSGFYDEWLDTYFKRLADLGVSDSAMGMWVPFPEANLPYWNHQNSRPDDFAANVTKIVTIQKRHFPASQASVMLNSATYATDDFEWSSGEYVSLVPYVKDIPKGLIDSFGYQGLPWLPNALQVGPGVVDANQYLDSKLAKEAADTLGVKSIWFNTGTFGRKYTLDPESTITVSPERRKDILSGVLVQAKKLQEQGYNVAVNLFAEDKSDNPEATDWSYWPQDDPESSADSVVFADFAASLIENKIELWLFDKEK